MKKLTALLLVTVLCVPVAILAESDSHAKKIIEMVKDGKQGKYHGHDGVLRTPRISGQAILAPTTVTSTAEYVLLANEATLILIDASAQGLAVITNTITAPSEAGAFCIIVNNGVSNSVLITEGTTLDSGGNKTLGPEDALLLIGRDTSAWSGIYHDN